MSKEPLKAFSQEVFGGTNIDPHEVFGRLGTGINILDYLVTQTTYELDTNFHKPPATMYTILYVSLIFQTPPEVRPLEVPNIASQGISRILED